MTTDPSFPDLIADRVSASLRNMITGRTDPSSVATLDRLVQHSVYQAFGCTCPPPSDDGPVSPRRTTCPLHGPARRARSHDEAVMPSQQAGSWEDPYYYHSTTERREEVQGGLRRATEFSRSFHNELAARRGNMAQEQVEQAIEHASFNGGLTQSELEMAELALSAVQYALRLLYAAGNYVDDQPTSDDQYR